MARMKPIQIPKTVSSPANPSAPSFLGALPPEIRNRIYEAMFKSDGTVLLHDAKAYREQFSDTLRDNLRLNEARDWDDEKPFVDVELYVEDQEFNLGFHSSIALLHTCRQIYHEATGVLYGSNVFYFKQMPMSMCSYEAHCMQHDYAPSWLLRIGTHAALLFKVFIDLEDCPIGPRCYEWHKTIGLLPFLRLQRACCKIEFTRPESATSRVLAYVLNNIRVALGTEGVLNIKRYSEFSRLMPAIHIYSAKDSQDSLHGK
jgi:hypothetical protein